MNELKKKILDCTSGGYDVFEKYFGEQCSSHTFLNIYRGDTRRSCTLYMRHGKFCLTDFGDSDWSGDCFHVVAKIQQLNLQTQFVEVMKVIDKECSLGIFNDNISYVSNRREGIDDLDRKEYHKVTSFKATYKDFSERELKYWWKYGIGKKTLDRFNVRSLSSCRYIRDDGSDFTIFGSVQFPMYGYLFGEGDCQGIKTYRPGSDVRFLRAGIFPSPYVFGAAQLPERARLLVITGGEKDVMSLSSHGVPAICYNSETARIPIADLRAYVSRFYEVVILYDMDEAGWKAARQRWEDIRQFAPELLRKVGIGSLPLSGTKFSKDVSDFFSSGKDFGDFECSLKTIFNSEKFPFD